MIVGAFRATLPNKMMASWGLAVGCIWFDR